MRTTDNQNESAWALLQTVRDQLTGREIRVCEEMVREGEVDADHDSGDEMTYGPSGSYGTSDSFVFKMLEIQFSAEIMRWKDRGSIPDDDYEP